MGSFCGSNPQTVVQTASNPNVTAQQNQVYGLANDYAQRFGGDPSQLVAPWNQLQTTAAQGVADNANMMQPWVNLGEGMTGYGSTVAGASPSFYGAGAGVLGGMNPIASQAWNPTAYESPYTQDVINATRANIEQSNAVAQNGALGNLIQSGTAFGGDRAGVTMDELARNQALAENQTIAGLQQANFNQASQQANAQQQYLLNLGLGNNSQLLQQAGAYGTLGGGLTQAGLAQGNLGMQLGNLGSLGQSGLMNAYQGLYNMGVGLQGTQQQQLSAPMTFAQWYANASPGTASVPTSTTYPGANPLSQIVGLGIAGLGGASLLSNLGFFGAAALNKGGRVGKDDGGAVGDHHMHDLLQRYHAIKRAVGGDAMLDPGSMMMQEAYGNNTTPADKTAIGRNNRLQTYLSAAGEYNQRGQPESTQLAVNRMESLPQQSHGGRVHRYVGGTDSMSDTGSTGDGGGQQIGDSWSAGADNASAPTFDPGQHLSDILMAHQQQQKTLQDAMKFLLNHQKQNDPTKPPPAPNQPNYGQMVQGAMSLANLGDGGGYMESSRGGGIPHAADGLSYDDSTGMGGADADTGGGGGGLQAISDLYNAIDSRVRAGRPYYNPPSLPSIAPVTPAKSDPYADTPEHAVRDVKSLFTSDPARADLPSQPSADLTAGAEGPHSADRPAGYVGHGVRYDPKLGRAVVDYGDTAANPEDMAASQYATEQAQALPEQTPGTQVSSSEPQTGPMSRPGQPKRLEDMSYDELAKYQLMRAIRNQDRNQSMQPGLFALQLARMFFPHRSGVGTMDPSFGEGAGAAASQITQSQGQDSEAAARTAAMIHGQQQLAQQKELALKPQFHTVADEFGVPRAVRFDPATGTMSQITPGAAAGAPATSSGPPGLTLPTGLDWTKTGQDFVDQLPPAWKGELEQIAQAKKAYPSSSSRDPHAKILAAMLPLAYPGIDASVWHTRDSTRKAFATGPEGRQISSLDMFAGHTEELSKAIEALNNNVPLPFSNEARAITNWAGGKMNPEGLGARINRVQIAGSGVGEELSKLLHGGPNVSGAEEWKKAIADTNLSRGQQRAKVGQAADLVLERVRALEDQWERGMGASREAMGEKPLISPVTRARLERLSAMGKQNLSPEEYDAQHPGGAAGHGAVQGRPVPPKVAEILQDAIKTGAPTVKLPDGREMPTKEFAQRVVQKLQSGQWVEKQQHGG